MSGAGGNAGLRRSLIEAAAVLIVALVCALGSWLIRTPRLPLAADREVYEFELEQPLLSPAQALARYEAGTHLFVDTREIDLSSRPHIPGALSLRPATFDDDLLAVIDFLYPEDPIVLYGDRLQSTAAVAGRLAERGYEDLALIAGGFDAWRAAGGPVESPAGEGTP